jgi:hypothetical protein
VRRLSVANFDSGEKSHVSGEEPGGFGRLRTLSQAAPDGAAGKSRPDREEHARRPDLRLRTSHPTPGSAGQGGARHQGDRRFDASRASRNGEAVIHRDLWQPGRQPVKRKMVREGHPRARGRREPNALIGVIVSRPPGPRSLRTLRSFPIMQRTQRRSPHITCNQFPSARHSRLRLNENGRGATGGNLAKRRSRDLGEIKP